MARGRGMARETHAVLFAARDGAHADGAQPCHHPCWEVLAGRVGVAKPALRARVSNNMWSSWYEIRACLSSIRITCGHPGTYTDKAKGLYVQCTAGH